MSSSTYVHLLRRALGVRGFRVLFAAAAFLAVALVSPPSSPNPAGARPGGPSADEARVLDDLALWVFDDEAEDDLAAAVLDRQLGFELFRSYANDRVREALVTALPHGELLWRTGQRWGIDPLLLASVVETESGFDAEAVSMQGALGLMQVLPETADLFRPVADPMDPAVNVEVGARYLRSQLKLFDGDLPLALAAYNAGPGNVIRFAGIPPFRETRRYVRRVLANYVGHLRDSWRDSGDLDWLVVES
jgi:soluble lytic murein transglycosylase-like protein